MDVSTIVGLVTAMLPLALGIAAGIRHLRRRHRAGEAAPPPFSIDAADPFGHLSDADRDAWLAGGGGSP